jgi:hypothetical protein
MKRKNSIVTSLRVVLECAEINSCTCPYTDEPPEKHSHACHVWHIRNECRAVRTFITKLAKNPKL